MSLPWVNLSTRWSLSDVQAALNVIVSVLGRMGIWSFSRLWWQRAATKIVCDNVEVPLSTLYTVAAPGEGWDTIRVLERQVVVKPDKCHRLAYLKADSSYAKKTGGYFFKSSSSPS